MNYEIVQLEEKTIVGISAVTGNMEPDMGEKIHGLWDRLYDKDLTLYNSIKNKVNEYAIGLYSDYEGTRYQITTGIEVSKNENPELVAKTIPGGRYAKFSIQGDMTAAVAQAWQQIWEMDLDRSYAADFEEYLDSDMENAKIDIYISLK